jgi:hypothetical protein
MRRPLGSRRRCTVSERSSCRSVEALAGTRILQKVGAKTPDLRRALKADVENILLALGALGDNEFENVKCEFGKAWKGFKEVLLMEFAEGETLKVMRKKHVGEFLEIIQNPTFQVELGKVLAADVFSGNTDRMHAYQPNYQVGDDIPPLRGWYHEKNLLMNGAQNKPVAIDNAFERTDIDRWKEHPWGRRSLDPIRSLAAASNELILQEAGLLFDRFLETAAEDNKSAAEEIEKARKSKSAFQENVKLGANDGMNILLQRGQGWKSQLSKEGVTGDEEVNDFRLRKRVLRQIAKGIGWNEAVNRAKDETNYRHWLLHKEFFVNDEATLKELSMSVDKYKKYKKDYQANMGVD